MEIEQFLACRTPDSWIEAALAQQDILLIDHAHCEKKAASTALNLMYRYPGKYDLLQKMSRLAREELRHFEKALDFIKERNVDYRHLSPSRYAGGLREHVRPSEPHRLVDTLIVGAYIEARSCERFKVLAPHLDERLGKFYLGLLSSESRHFMDYILLAERYADEDISDRVELFATVEQELIESTDELFRFHSGIPV